MILVFNSYLKQTTSFAYAHSPARAWISIAGQTPVFVFSQPMYGSANMFNPS